jgi:hypothetical protein
MPDFWIRLDLDMMLGTDPAHVTFCLDAHCIGPFNLEAARLNTCLD